MRPPVTTRSTRATAYLVAVGVVTSAALGLSGCRDSDDGSAPTTTTTAPIEIPTTAAPDTGGIDVDAPDGTQPIAIPSVGFGVAVPEGWEAAVLTDDALERIDKASLVNQFFLDAARQTQATGAIFYAAGIDAEGRVSELKIDRVDGVATDRDALLAQAETVAAADGLQDAVVRPAADEHPELVVVDFVAAQQSAADGAPIEVHGSQVFVGDVDRVWSLLVTAEDDTTRDLLVTLFADTFVVAPR